MSSNDSALQFYMRRIGQLPLLTLEEECELTRRSMAGDEAARERLVCCNLRLVVKIAHDFRGLGLPLIDLVAEGNIGLMRAVETFDPAKGAKLSSYASWWIKQSMRRGIAKHARTVRVPIQTARKMSKAKAAGARLALKHGREPTDREVAAETGMPEGTMARMRKGQPTVFSLHEPIQHGEEGEHLDMMADGREPGPDEIAQHEDTIGRLRSLLGRLDERERTIINLRFDLDGGKPKTLDCVSKDMRRTRERIRQIQTGAITKLRAMMRAEEPG